MSAEARVLSVGHITHDVYPEGIVPGGCAYYGARVYESLGAHSELFTGVGDDFACMDEVAHLLNHCAHEGLTTCFRNVYPPDGIRIQRVDAQGPMISPPTHVGEYDVVHLAPVMNEVDLGAWLEVVGETPSAISVQGWIKAAGPPFREAYPELTEQGPATARAVVQIPWTPREDDLRRVKIACLGAEDLIGQGDLLERLIGNIPIVACTHGRNGADIYIDGRPTHVGTFVVDDLDPTGAGDTFAAGFIYGVATGLHPVAAASLGAAAASIVVEEVGGQAIPRIAAEARERARQIR